MSAGTSTVEGACAFIEAAMTISDSETLYRRDYGALQSGGGGLAMGQFTATPA